MKVSTLGIDLTKNTFQLHAVSHREEKIFSKKVKRKKLLSMVEKFDKGDDFLIAMEACGGAHHVARTLMAMGYHVKLISPKFVKPFVKSNKNDAKDAEAITEAARRPSMRFVGVKSVEQQDIQAIHRIREGFIKRRTATANEIRGLLRNNLSCQPTHKVVPDSEPCSILLTMFIRKVREFARDFQKDYKTSPPFEEQAHEALKKYDFTGAFSYTELIDYSKTEEAQKIKFYKENNFGEYPVTLFRNEIFFIDAYIWQTQDTSIHNHSFVGAFKVLQGASLETQYSFKQTKENTAVNLKYGHFKQKKKGVLKTGDSEKIMLGDQYIHQVWHLEKPTITLCLRSFSRRPFEEIFHLDQMKIASSRQLDFSICDPFDEYMTGIKFTYHTNNVYSLFLSLIPMDETQRGDKLDSLKDASILWRLFTLAGFYTCSFKSERYLPIWNHTIFLLEKKFNIPMHHKTIARRDLTYGKLKYLARHS